MPTFGGNLLRPESRKFDQKKGSGDVTIMMDEVER